MVDGYIEISLAGIAIGRPQLRLIPYIDMNEAQVVVAELALAADGMGAGCRWAPVESLGPEDVPDAVAVEVGQEVPDNEGQLIEAEARWSAELADNGALFLFGAPGQSLGAAGVVVTRLGSPEVPRLRHLRMISALMS